MSFAPLILSSLAVFLIVLYNIQHFSKRDSPWYVKLVSLVSWYLPFTIVFLLPFDLISTLYRKCSDGSCSMPKSYLEPEFFHFCWRILYWITFCLTWLTIPFLQSFVDCGEFSLRNKFKRAIKSNLIYYTIAFIGFISFLIYLVITQQIRDFESLFSFLMAMSNCWGLLLIIGFMGYGLVAYPKSLYQKSNIQHQLENVLIQLVNLNDEKYQLKEDIQKIAFEIQSLGSKISETSPFYHYYRVLIEKCPAVHLDDNFSPNSSTPKLSEKYFVSMNHQLNRLLERQERLEALWNRHLNKAFLFQDIIDNLDQPSKTFSWTFPSKKPKSVLRRKLDWLWYCSLRSSFYRSFALICAVWSIAIIWSEVTFMFSNPPLSIVAIIFHSLGFSYGIIEILSFLTVSYMCLCAYSSLLQIKIFNLYVLAPKHSSDRSLLFFGAYLCRLAMPLCYNFLNIVTEQQDTIFSKFMGQIDLVPFLGQNFNSWVPMIILIPVLSTLFNLQNRLLRIFDGDEDGSNGYRSITVDEGRILLEECKSEALKRSPNNDSSRSSFSNSFRNKNKYARQPTGSTSHSLPSSLN